MSASVLPPAPSRQPIVGTLTLAHLKPRVPAAPPPPAIGDASSDAGQSTRVTLPLMKGGRPRQLGLPTKKQAASTGAEKVAAKPTNVGKPNPAAERAAAVSPPEKERSANDELLKRFHRAAREKWPAAFPLRDRTTGHLEISPLALGSKAILLAGLDGILTPEEVKACMRQWTMRTPYLQGTIRHHENGMPRINLDGSPSADPVLEADVRRASAILEARGRKHAKPAGGEEMPANPKP